MVEFYEIGKKTKTVDVRISYKIIKLFSEGLYSSPNKAVEELVCNSFDADAKNVHVIIPIDNSAPDATIAVIDDGDSMDYDALSQHWVIGKSPKTTRLSRQKRKQIGKFGIGKLATYVLSNRLTHICKKNGKFYSVSMDYREIQKDTEAGVFDEEKEKVVLPFRELTGAEAKEAIKPFITGAKQGHKAIKFFGKGASKNWTVAIMSELKEMITNLKSGRLKWVLRTAMPLRDDFKLYLNGNEIKSSKIGKASKAWVLGKHISSDDLEAARIEFDETVIKTLPKNHIQKFGLTNASLGRLFGYIELHNDRLDTGKSSENYRSNGFFIYAHGRLINEEDGHFGIPGNELSHGTLSRFRAVIHADALDQQLRSSRETVRECEVVNNFRNVLKAIFNIARREWTRKEKEAKPGAKFANTVQSSPYSLTQLPLLSLLSQALKGDAAPQYLKYPVGLNKEERIEYLQEIEERIETQGNLVLTSEVRELSLDQRVAVFEIDTGTLVINRQHPFVAHFLDEYENIKVSLPLELLAMSEVLLEANLYQFGIDASMVNSIMDIRDELLRTLAKASHKKNVYLIAQELVEAVSEKKGLEIGLVAAFNSMGFEAIPLGGKKKPDGMATAALGLGENGVPQRYKVSLEAKSKEKEGKKVSNSSVRVSTVARHRKDYGCDHAIVVGPDFPRAGTALEEEIKQNNEQTGKTITIMNIADLARLVRLRPLKRIGPLEIRELFKNCTMPDECREWVDMIEKRRTEIPKYKKVLEIIFERQKKRHDESVEYGTVAAKLEDQNIVYTRAKIVDICRALEGMAPNCISCRDNSVELRTKPDIVLERIKAETEKYPESETGKSFLRNL